MTDAQLMIDGYVVTDITLRTWEHASGIEWPMICFTSSSPKIANFRVCMHAAHFWEKVNQSAAMQRLTVENGDENGK